IVSTWFHRAPLAVQGGQGAGVGVSHFTETQNACADPLMTGAFCQLSIHILPPGRLLGLGHEPGREGVRVEPSDPLQLLWATLSKSLNGPVSGVPRAATSMRGVVRRGLLTLIGLTGALLLAHEGHDEAVRPVYKEVQVGGTLYRAGFAVVPQDPVVG